MMATYIGELVEQNQFMPPGFNENCTRLIKLDGGGGKTRLDLAALIASALSSNLYLNGLAHLDYLNLPANLKPFYGKFSDHSADNKARLDEESQIMAAAVDEFANSSYPNKAQLSKDVMNDNVRLE